MLRNYAKRNVVPVAVDRPVRDEALFSERQPALRTGLLSPGPSGTIATLRSMRTRLKSPTRPLTGRAPLLKINPALKRVGYFQRIAMGSSIL